MTLTKTFLLVCLLATVAVDDPPKKDDAESFKGTWKALSVNQGGQNVPEEFVKSMAFKFDGKKYVQKVQDQSDEEGDYSIDASQSPKTIDLDIKTGNDQGKKQVGIYKFEDGKLTFIVAKAGSKDRPKSFKLEKDADVIEFVLEREKS
jgi:uncharacterized protein (TIGR03067 family)